VGEHGIEQGVTAAQGFAAAAVQCGIKEGSTKPDLTVVLSDRPANVAAVFTQNRAAAAPVILSRERANNGRATAVVANSGNANACTGPQGLQDARDMSAAVAQRFGLSDDDVLVLSTGVIGVPLPMPKILHGIDRLEPSADAGLDFAHAIMTTDTRQKVYAVEREIGGVNVRIGGAAKGSGMIHPNMATLLGVITTDAQVEPQFLHSSLKSAVDLTFNMISIDGDTSTNDAVLVLANGAAGGTLIGEGTAGAELFSRALLDVCTTLAKEIVRDGEGAHCLIEIRVTGAHSGSDARQIARSISASALVKTAVFGADPNWGRVLCAAGYSGGELDPDRATLHLDDICLLRLGTGMPYDRSRATELLRQPLVTFSLDLGLGDGAAVAWGCDMSYDYVRINAEYTT
jgi:glutamate N-acetyltransferase/amino-acid N-acetyltransferase